ncbi:unnamed protein product [Paramecium pentaurelia]|uniref:uracil phosphoribosyltransferase n=1 Tax=Paramecium pentaurelia TaxID=43138 RepID=A0A8S1T7F5_9CILI|nr:unnamed protein product [Paramecium pentaurelia]
MFKNLSKFVCCLGLVNGTQMACSQLQNDHSYNRMQHYNFLSQDQLHNLLNKHKNLFILRENQTQHILSMIRDVNSDIVTFRQNSDRLIRILLEQALAHIEKKNSIKQSPLGFYDANQVKFSDQEICIVSILRSGNAFLNEALKVIQGASIGQILIQRNEETSMPKYFFEKLPENINEQQIILVDPMLGTGGSASMALKILQNYGVKQENIIFLNLVSCEQGLNKVFKEYPKIKIITAQVDPILIKEINYLAPGIGDFGDRYFGTVKKHTRAEQV